MCAVILFFDKLYRLSVGTEYVKIVSHHGKKFKVLNVVEFMYSGKWTGLIRCPNWYIVFLVRNLYIYVAC